jgi:hypothetical protein
MIGDTRDEFYESVSTTLGTCQVCFFLFSQKEGLENGPAMRTSVLINRHDLTTPYISVQQFSIKSFPIISTDIVGRRGADIMCPVLVRTLLLPHIRTLITESADIGFSTPQQGGFIVAFNNIVFAVPATVFGHANLPFGYTRSRVLKNSRGIFIIQALDDHKKHLCSLRHIPLDTPFSLWHETFFTNYKGLKCRIRGK